MSENSLSKILNALLADLVSDEISRKALTLITKATHLEIPGPGDRVIGSASDKIKLLWSFCWMLTNSVHKFGAEIQLWKAELGDSMNPLAAHSLYQKNTCQIGLTVLRSFMQRIVTEAIWEEFPETRGMIVAVRTDWQVVVTEPEEKGESDE